MTAQVLHPTALQDIASPWTDQEDITNLDFSTWNEDPQIIIPGVGVGAGYNDPSSPSSFLVFNPVVESVSTPAQQQVDWRRYDTPVELFDSQPETSREVRDLLAASVESIKARHLEEEAARAARARQERPIGRARRATARPKVEIEVKNLRNDQRLSSAASQSERSTSQSSSSAASQSQRLSTGSTVSISSTAPSYIAEAVPSSPLRAGFNLGGIFKRKQKSPSVSNVEILVESSSDPASQTSLRSPTRTTGECVSCLEDFKAADLIKLKCHDYFKACFKKLISTAMESETHWPAKCCLNTIASSDILPHLDNMAKRKFKQREQEWSVPVEDRIYCWKLTCSAWIPPKNIRRQTNTARCPTCARRTCVSCRGEPHGTDQCPQDTSFQATIKLAELRGWKRCYKCHALVEHNNGCRHMTCRCKAQFCYICGSKWPTCTCSDAQLEDIQIRLADQQVQGAALTAEQLAEEAEVRDAINTVAAIERSEAERRQQQLDTQQQLDEIRRQREERRVAAVNRRFRQLDAELALLHDFQRVWMAERYEFEATMQLKERQDALDVISVRHFCELQLLHAESQQINSDAKYDFEHEYHVRLAEEKHVESEYVDQLRSHWTGRPEADDRVREARLALRSRQDESHKIWDAHRRRQLEVIAEREDQKMEILKERHASEINAVEGRSKIDELEWKKKTSAEAIWVDEVVRERIAMLQRLEREEYSRET